MSAKKIQSIDDLTPDLHNANKGTERGQYMIEHSLEQHGAGRSIVADAEGRIIAGNKTLQAAADLGLGVRVVQTDGHELVVVQRTDLDLQGTDDRARLLAYADNRSSEVGLDWDAEEIVMDMASGVDLSGLFRDDELDEIEELARLSDEIDAALGEDYEPSDRDIDATGTRMVKSVLYLADIAEFEEALALTGEVNRGEAMMVVVRAYLRDADATEG